MELRKLDIDAQRLAMDDPGDELSPWRPHVDPRAFDLVAPGDAL
jgi:hypothetical protein